MAATSQRNPITAFIAGEVPLARMFWLHGVVAGFAAGMALGGLGGISAELQRAWAVLLLAYLLAWYIGLWRSANRYAGPAVWKWAARAVVAMPFMGILFALILSAGTANRVANSPAAASQVAPPTTTQPAVPHANEDGPWKKYQSQQSVSQEKWVPAPPNLKPFDGKLDGEK